ncbi:hypothetical protein COT75_03645 [Candidatus Beckwithbacteria bacterium CG10_big_fil_rev_8_21_14_0_10_34_10]|uniref:Uncharacterized protein n=1 Tax=Candidatus Beckwithbacteria bacterium CG10_big_fil_rev_8_21_14_0_10_34_10 TaxID=1974495 RepID=A0A2H0W8Q8_9BACT|nr:MAG: hypothetical protein COT75_03645 [Candidatus Beckwithbacteria bacterium CG10_big_fil_rev_8_21_14_0_10_34_10]
MKAKEFFFKAYANLPLSLRQEIIVVLDNEPLSWNAVKIEIENETSKGKAILVKLVQMRIIKEDG